MVYGGGKLVVPLKYTLGRNGVIAMLVSENGVDWTLGEEIAGERNQSCDLGEEEGKLVCVLAQSSGSNKRTVAYSGDGGLTWNEPTELEVNTGEGGNQLDGRRLGWEMAKGTLHPYRTGERLELYPDSSFQQLDRRNEKPEDHVHQEFAGFCNRIHHVCICRQGNKLGRCNESVFPGNFQGLRLPGRKYGCHCFG